MFNLTILYIYISPKYKTSIIYTVIIYEQFSNHDLDVEI